MGARESSPPYPLVDWLARFDVRTHEGELKVHDRDGTEYEGREARWLIRSRLPLLMPLFAPLLLRIRKRKPA